MTETKPPSADVLEFVGRGVSAQNGVDAAIAGACVGLVRQEILQTLAASSMRNPIVADAHARQALNELHALELRLLEHFERLGVRKGPKP